MSLPSQRRSFGPRVSPRSRRGPAGPKLIGGAVLLATVAGGAWLLLRGGGEPEPRIFDDDSAFAAAAVEAESESDAGIDAGDFVSSGVLASTVDRPQTNEAPAAREQVTQPIVSEVVRDVTPSRPIESAPPTRRAAGVAGLVDEARQLLGQQQLVAARDRLNEALKHPDATEQDRAMIRGDMAVLNEDLFFSPKVYEGDPLAFGYQIQSGDRLAAIAANRGLGVDWRLIQRINNISSPNRIRVGQRLKLVQGPMHAIVDKSDYRMDLYAGPPGAMDQWMYIRSFSVGLGEDNSTPVGRFVVRPASKLINPVWRNPRTGEFFAADNPENPIGERWVGLEGTGEIANVEGYGIHGTIESGSIGQDASMGCVRLNDGDVAMVYECLEESVSEVHIRP
ncbi:MAG: L,D-transpeptidase family protein [Planctomycetota bacterium]